MWYVKGLSEYHINGTKKNNIFIQPEEKFWKYFLVTRLWKAVEIVKVSVVF
jgi:hypothetical protein